MPDDRPASSPTPAALEWQVMMLDAPGGDVHIHVFPDEGAARAFAAANPIIEIHEGDLTTTKPAHVRKVHRYGAVQP